MPEWRTRLTRTWSLAFTSAMVSQPHPQPPLTSQKTQRGGLTGDLKGDMEHKHVAEPESLQGVADFASSILDKCDRPASFLHCPVALSAIDRLDDYFRPLEALVPRLRRDGTELYLGLVHAGDMESTRRMVKAASKVAPEFGVATECGWGRTPADHLEGIMEISTAVSEPFAEYTSKEM